MVVRSPALCGDGNRKIAVPTDISLYGSCDNLWFLPVNLRTTRARLTQYSEFAVDPIFYDRHLPCGFMHNRKLIIAGSHPP